MRTKATARYFGQPEAAQPPSSKQPLTRRLTGPASLANSEAADTSEGDGQRVHRDAWHQLRLFRHGEWRSGDGYAKASAAELAKQRRHNRDYPRLPAHD